MDATISVVCYKSKTLSNGEHPLMLRISKDGKKKYQSLGISVNPKFWDFQKNKPKPKCPNLEYLQKIILDKKLELQKKKLEIKSDQKEYSAATLLEANANLLVAKTVDCFYKEIIAQCEINNKCGNRLVYLNSYNSLKRFTNGKLEIPFNSINVAWLEKYEKWLRSNGNKETTISLMFRTLRSTYNKAIKERCAHLSDYPFQEYKISKFDTSTQKRAIAKTDMLKFTETSQPIGQKKYVELSKDIFIFSYLCGGINFTDIANLTQENIVNGSLKEGNWGPMDLIEADIDTISIADVKSKHDFSRIKNNMNGYSETLQMLANHEGDASFVSDCRAFYLVKTYNNSNKVPDGIERSPWFLPSIGQWFDVLVNICGKSPENFRHNTGNGLQDEKWGQETLDKLEGQLSKVGKSLPQFNVNYRLGFSCSSQYDKDRSWMLLWHIDDPLYKWERVCLQGYNKTSAWHVRPFFAF